VENPKGFERDTSIPTSPALDSQLGQASGAVPLTDLVNTIKIENTQQNISSCNRSHGIGEVTSSLQLPFDSADKKVSHIVVLTLI